ncbi:2-octaprenyl-6-methoxyphenyl hydroxylase [Microbulbifer sp. TYP-18]|uniref:2-octaprenyl-6-methoxyphenyl hydroxylase n=1 Tax=Microbulbifer sp. TYP-18 TaxID=3230024 RepID=UPI0034C6A3D5
MKLGSRIDVAIVGGGMAGASLALLLAKFCPNLSVALLEQRPLMDPGASIALPSFDTRATALAAGSLQLFDELGLWPQLKPYCAPISRVRVSDRGRAAGVAFTADKQRRASFAGMLGAVIENAALGPVLYRALAQLPVTLVSPAQVERVRVCDQGVDLGWQGEDGPGCLAARLLVVADGVDSPLCRQLGIETERVEYRQRALVATLATQRDHGGVAYERFTDRGPMAMLPLPRRDGSHRMALVWTCPEEDAGELQALSPAAFVQRVQSAFGWRAGRILRSGELQGYPLSLHVAREQWRRNLVLLGNCAHFLHPVAGQGFNLTLRDSYHLATTLAAGCCTGESPGQLNLLEEYGRARRLDQQLTIGFSDRVPALFAAPGLLAGGLRQAGLLGLNLAPSLRASFIGQAAGFGL